MTARERKPLIHVVDDDKVVVDSLILLLTFMGFRAVPWNSASEFVEADPLEQGDLLLIDLQMPDMDGFEALIQLRANGHHNPALLMTGNGYSDIERDARRLGFSAVLHKPFSEKDLLAAVNAARGKER